MEDNIKPSLTTTGNKVEIVLSKHTLFDIAAVLVAVSVAVYILHRIVSKHMN